MRNRIRNLGITCLLVGVEKKPLFIPLPGGRDPLPASVARQVIGPESGPEVSAEHSFATVLKAFPGALTGTTVWFPDKIFIPFISFYVKMKYNMISTYILLASVFWTPNEGPFG